MSWLGRLALSAYLALFASFMRDPKDARTERELLLGSLEYVYDDARAAGRGRLHAALTTLRLHAGELQPFAVIARIRAANERATVTGTGTRSIGRPAVGLGVLATVGAILIWGMGALGWIFLALTVGALASIVWSARHAGARWLIPLVPLLMLWPFVARRMGDGRGSVAINDAAAASLLLLVALVAHELWRPKLTNRAGWRDLVTFAGTPLIWATMYAIYARVDALLLVNGAFTNEARFGLPADKTSAALGIAAFVLVALYWLVLARLTARVATHYDDRPLETRTPSTS